MVSRNELEKISGSTFSMADSTLSDRLKTFVENYSLLAILRGTYLKDYTLEPLKKVINSSIYFYDGEQM